jgi:hypothetical protein
MNSIWWGEDHEKVLDDAEMVDLAMRRAIPWWRNAEWILTSFPMGEDRVAWYSEVTGRPVTAETILLPSLTTLDAMHDFVHLTQTGLATTVWATQAAGIGHHSTVGIGKVWESNVDWIADSLAPGFDRIFEDAALPIFGDNKRRSARGVPVSQREAQILHRLGWGDFLGTYRDSDGRVRYKADQNALSIVGRIIMLLPPTQDLIKNVTHIDNPAMRESVTLGFLEALGRFTGFARFAPGNPLQDEQFEAWNQESAVERALKQAQVEAGN